MVIASNNYKNEFSEFYPIPDLAPLSTAILVIEYEYEFIPNDKIITFIIENKFVVSPTNEQPESLVQGSKSYYEIKTDGNISIKDLYEIHETSISVLKNHLYSINEYHSTFSKAMIPPHISLVKKDLQLFVDHFQNHQP